MPQIVYQQTIETTEDLVRKWPRLGRVIRAEDVQAGVDFHRSRGVEAFSLDDKTATEALKFYNAVIADGRYVGLLETDPAQAA
jgi:hypothetical protein